MKVLVYRWARGSTSLVSFLSTHKSFHPRFDASHILMHVMHIQRLFHNLIFSNVYIGTSANNLNFQTYLFEGLHRWNQDHGSALLTFGYDLLYYLCFRGAHRGYSISSGRLVRHCRIAARIKRRQLS